MAEIPQLGLPGGFQVPNAPRVPVQSEAMERVQQGANQLGHEAAVVFGGLRRLQINAKVANAESQYQLGLINQAQSIESDPKRMNTYLSQDPVTGRNNFQADLLQGANDLRDNILKENPDIAIELRPNLEERRQAHVYQMGNRFIAKYDDNARMQFSGPVMNSRISSILANPDPKMAQRDTEDFHQQIQTVPGLLPNERQSMAARFDNELAVGRLGQLGLDNPGAVLRMRTPPPNVLPGQLATAQSKALTDMMLGHRELQDAHALQRDAVIQNLDQMQASHDPRLGAATAAAVQNGHIDQREARTYVPGFKEVEPSEPGARDSVKAQIDENPMGLTSYDIRTWPGLSNKDRGDAMAYWRDSQKQAKTQIGGMAMGMRPRLVEEWFPASAMTKAQEALHPGERSRRIQEFTNDFNTLAKEATSVKDLTEIPNKLKQVWGEPKGKLPPPPPMLPGEDIGSYRNRISPMGY